MNNLMVILPLVGFCIAGAGFLGWQQWEFNRMLKENAELVLKRRMNVATFNSYERQEAKEWM